MVGQMFGLSALQASTLAPRVHRVRRGDTLSALAGRYGVSVAALKARNGLDTDVIRIGQKLSIPPPELLNHVIATTSRLDIRRGRWTHVVAHHSAIDAGNAAIYDAAHRRRGMEHGLAYDFVIGNGRDSGDGEIEIGPRWLKQIDGGHVRNPYYNAHGIGICMVGNFEKHRPTDKQLIAFASLVDWLRIDAPLGSKPKFTVHRWVDPHHTVCPGRYFPYTTMKRRFARA